MDNDFYDSHSNGNNYNISFIRIEWLIRHV